VDRLDKDALLASEQEKFFTEPHYGFLVRSSLKLAVPDTRAAMDWYQQALGATQRWDFGSVVGLEVSGAPFFLAEPANNG
jgi:hypothetical protein